MRSEADPDITRLLQAWSCGEPGALAELTPLLYDELHRLAKRHVVAEAPGQTLNTTALVHEAWLRLVSIKEVHLEHRAQFFALCAQLMRRILVDQARARLRAGNGRARVSLHEELLIPEERVAAVAALDDALEALSALDARKGRVVELRFFGGLSVEETAEVLGISPESVKRDWKLAKLWLIREMKGGGGHAK
jgi:RNA polymerase sigma factor (TIGR02999 family)